MSRYQLISDCLERYKEHGGIENLFQAREELDKLTKEHENNKERELWARFLTWSPEATPRGFENNPYYVDGDEDTPFVSEAYLYNLLGKMDARTLLAFLRQIAENAGFDLRSLQSEVYREK